jgi:predicted RNA binding protein YcfA (HicA-like mRNA interferase family)
METDREKIRRRLEAEGWRLVRHGRAHDIFRHPRIAGIITLPRHRRLSPGVVRSIARKAGWEEV